MSARDDLLGNSRRQAKKENTMMETTKSGGSKGASSMFNVFNFWNYTIYDRVYTCLVQTVLIMWSQVFGKWPELSVKFIRKIIFLKF